ncbi:MAG: ribonuclease HI [Mariprofundales bacterium]
MQAIEIWTDGACSGNPGPGGWGVLLRCGVHEKELCGGEKHTTNQQMELQAAVEALRALKRPSKVRLFTDSRYVQQGMLSWIHGWKKRGWKNSKKQAVANVERWQALDALATQHHIEWCWVKGHAGIEGNERADELARQGLDEFK